MNTDSLKIVVAVIALCAVGMAGQAFAQEKRLFTVSSTGTKSQYIQQLAIDVDDVSGHQVRVYEIKRTFAVGNAPVIDGVKVVDQLIRGWSNYIAGVGPAMGFYTYIMENGEKIFLEFTAATEAKISESGSKRGSSHSTAKIVGGTGHFAKIRGTVVEVTEFDSDPANGFNRGTGRGEYWFEK
jgi:hypothetical protein